MSKIRVTQQQRDNLLDALNVMWPSVPPDNVAPNLYTFIEGGYAKDIDCGTVACFGGWCSAWPAFISQGVEREIDGVPFMGKSYPARKIGLEVASVLFGYSIFSVRGGCQADDDFIGTDHALVTNRMQWLLENSEVAA